MNREESAIITGLRRETTGTVWPGSPHANEVAGQETRVIPTGNGVKNRKTTANRTDRCAMT